MLLPSTQTNSRCTVSARRQTENTQIAAAASPDLLPIFPAGIALARQTTADRGARPTARTPRRSPASACTPPLPLLPSPAAPFPTPGGTAASTPSIYSPYTAALEYLPCLASGRRGRRAILRGIFSRRRDFARAARASRKARSRWFRGRRGKELLFRRVVDDPSSASRLRPARRAAWKANRPHRAPRRAFAR